MVTTCARELARPRLIGSLLVLLAITSCGGPSMPDAAPPSSPLSPRAPSAPLPTLGSSFEDPPLTDAEQAPAAPDQEHPQGHGHAH